MKNNKKGIALIAAIVVISMVSIMLTSYVATVISERQRVAHETAAASAEYIARAGLEKVFFDLSCEYEKDNSWIDDDTINELIIDDDGDDTLETGEGMPLPSDNIDAAMSDYQRFYGTSDNPIVFADGNYEILIAFVKDATGNAFKDGRLWVKAIGRALDASGNTIDEVTIIQIAKVSGVALVEVDDTALGRPLVAIEEEYSSLDYQGSPDNSAEENLAARTSDHELRVSGVSLDEDVDISMAADEVLTIKGGYGFDFSDGSRDTSLNNTTLLDASGGSTVTISGGNSTSIVTIGGIRIE